MTTIHPTSGGPPDRIAAPGRAASRPAPVVAALQHRSDRADRIASLRQRIEAGAYHVPATAVADAIISSVRGSDRAAYEAAGAAARGRIG